MEEVLRVEKEVRLIRKEQDMGLGREENMLGRFPRKDFSTHLSPEYLQELKCKSQKLNPPAKCTQRRLWQEKQCGSFSPPQQPWWESASASAGFAGDGLRLVMRESQQDCRCGSHKAARVQLLIWDLSKPEAAC